MIVFTKALVNIPATNPPFVVIHGTGHVAEGGRAGNGEICPQVLPGTDS